MHDGGIGGMGFGMVVFWIVVVLAIAALIKYLLGNSGKK